MNRLYITKKCIVIEILSGVLCLIALILGTVQALTLPGPIPTHYGIMGEADAWGSPLSALLLPGIMLLVIGLVSLCLHRVPVERWNKPFAVRPGHETAVYRDFVLMMALIEPGVAVFALLATVANWVNRSVLMQVVTIGLVAWLVAVIVAGLIRSVHDNRA